MDAPDTTHLQWSPDGQHFMTSTTAPRLRVSNGYVSSIQRQGRLLCIKLLLIIRFKIWHYSGGLLFEYNIKNPDELWESTWQSLPDGHFKECKVSNKKVAGIKPSQPQGFYNTLVNLFCFLFILFIFQSFKRIISASWCSWNKRYSEIP